MRKDLDFDLPAVVSVSWRMRLDNDVNTYGYTDPSGARYGSFGGFGIKNTDEVTASVGINKYESDKKNRGLLSGRRRKPAAGATGRVDRVPDGCRLRRGPVFDVQGRRQVLRYNHGDGGTCRVGGTRWGESSGIHFSSGNSDNTVTRFDDIVIRGGSGGETRALASLWELPCHRPRVERKSEP